MKHEDYKLIKFDEISEDARKIAGAWFYYQPMGFDINNRHKLASDIMNYSNVQLAEYKTKLKGEIEGLLYPPGMSVNTSSTNCTLRMILALINKS